MKVGDTLIIREDAQLGTSEKEQLIKEVTDNEVVFAIKTTFTKYNPDGTVSFTEERDGEARMPKADAEKLEIKV